MPEGESQKPESGEASESPKVASAEVAAENKVPETFLCEFCGPDHPALKVFTCTLCNLNYCVKHLAPMAHYCFGALGKPQTIGVSGS